MKRILAVALVAVAIVALAVAPAFAEGYNNPTGPGDYTRATGFFSGPHGGYTTTTNKCQDCHSTHYAFGSFNLLRANSREAACDFCHGGGGGSTVNIMMDNDYRSGNYTIATASASESAGTWSGYGTGHTLGFTGNAPVDVDPAFSDSEGFACFDCHTPHGNSARVLEAFGTPSRPAGPGTIDTIYGVDFMTVQLYRIQESMKVKFNFNMFGNWAGMSGFEFLAPFAGYPDQYTVMPSDLKYMDDADMNGVPGTPTGGAEIGTWINANRSGEIASATANFYGWMGMMGDAPLPPTAAQMQAWAGSLGSTRTADGYHPITSGELQSLFALFTGAGGDTGAPGDAFSEPELAKLFMSWKVYWGEDTVAGNVTTAFLNMGDNQVAENNFMGMPLPGGYGAIGAPELEVWHKPLFAKGRYLLLKNPDNGDDVAGTNSLGLPTVDTNLAATGKKVGIDWEWPIGPAASWGPYFSIDGNERFPLAFPWAPKGVAMENEMCTSCHDGSAGESNQAASVWSPQDSDYITAYSHDSNARGCARAQYLNPNDGDNFGPHCANCHTGASGCQTCHSAEGGDTNWFTFGRNAFDPLNLAKTGYTETSTIFVEGETSFRGPASVRTSAVTNINGQCLDGGFSYPHRTLGANMLKDSLYGVDFDGETIAAGATRGVNGANNANLLANSAITSDLASFFGTGKSFESTRVIGAGTTVDNLDSVCIDCHGDATYWNGDNLAYKASFNSSDPLNPSVSWNVEGWNLLLKGLP